MVLHEFFAEDRQPSTYLNPPGWLLRREVERTTFVAKLGNRLAIAVREIFCSHPAVRRNAHQDRIRRQRLVEDAAILESCAYVEDEFVPGLGVDRVIHRADQHVRPPGEDARMRSALRNQERCAETADGAEQYRSGH